MARSRKLWKPAKKPNADTPERRVWTPGPSSKAVPAPSRSKRRLADVSKLAPVMLDHGWRFEDMERQKRGRRVMVGERWTCEYPQPDGSLGCKSFVWKSNPQPGQYHAWDCPYWHSEEGKGETPF